MKLKCMVVGHDIREVLVLNVLGKGIFREFIDKEKFTDKDEKWIKKYDDGKYSIITYKYKICKRCGEKL